MSVVATTPLSVDEFLARATAMSDGRHELVDGQIIAMAPESVRHNQIKGRAFRALADGIKQAALDCEAYTDGVAVRINARTCRIPDASVQCGSIDPDSMELTEPLIVVEVVSPSSGRGDTGAKVAEYFTVPSIRHYLIVDPFGARVILHSRTDRSGAILTTILTQGPIRLDPPGFAILAEALLGASIEG